MVYQDYITKFCVLHPLTSKKAAEMALQLPDIFLTFGAPVVLQGHDGTDFITQVMQELKYLWLQLSLVRGKPGDSQSQELAERPNSNITEILLEWMADNNLWDWSMGICFVQFAKNSAHDLGMTRAPYSALFRTDPRCGLTSASLPLDIINCLTTKEDLVSVLTTPAASPVPTAHEAPEDPTGTATRAEAATEPAPGSPSDEIRPQPQKPPPTQTVQTHSLLPPESMASEQPDSKADLCFHQQDEGAWRDQPGQVERRGLTSEMRRHGPVNIQLATMETM